MFRLIVVSLAAAAVALAGDAQAADLNAVLASAMQGSKVPAVGVLTIRNDRTEAEAVRGVRSMDGNERVRPGDAWNLNSDIKAMTVAMVARLADRGVLSWTTPLERMLPELAARMQPQYRSVTLVQILSHHSGLPHDLPDEAVKTFAEKEGSATATQLRYAYIGRALQDPPVGPTSSFNYSNTGLIVAAVVAERATGSSYEELMRKEVFAPLGMSHARFGPAGPGEIVGHIDGRPSRPEDRAPQFFAPAGGNNKMPLEDWARFCIDQLKGAAGHGRLLKTETYRLMQTPQSDGDAAMGWGVQATILGRRGPAMVHAGSDGNWSSLAAIFPDSGSGVLVVANAGESMGGDVAVKAVLAAALADLRPPAP
jgi:CubicO group peptidase (beta-lactamase class C family)